MIRKDEVSALVNREVAMTSDERLAEQIQWLLVDPYVVDRDWDYGKPGEQFPCWTVLEHYPSNTGIAYCESGFGPKCPWGLVSLSGPHMSIGMDSGWFSSLESAFKDSWAYEQA